MKENTQEIDAVATMCESVCETSPSLAPEQELRAEPHAETEEATAFAPKCEPTEESDDAPAIPLSAPFGELPPVDPELFERARVAVTALRGRGRQPNGQAGPNNTLRLRDGLRSRQLIEQPDVAAWHTRQVEIITADLGGASELTALKSALVRELARLEVILSVIGDELQRTGVLTGKGKVRALTTLHLKVLDRFMKGAALLGLDRRSRQVSSLRDYLGQAQPSSEEHE
jgi:hypothetical protein